MTVQDLIQILQNLPADQEVRIQHPYLDDTAILEDVVLIGPDRNTPILSAYF